MTTAPQRRPLSITPAGIMGTMLVAAVVLVCLRLGFWQLARLDERRALNSGIAARLDAPPIDDVSALSDTAGLFYRIITATGLYDNARSIIFPGRSRRGLPGVYLLTPLRVSGRNDAVLVNRGWVPSADAATVDIDAFARIEPVTVSGLLLPFPDSTRSLAPGERVRDDGGFRRVWYAVDERELRSQFPYELLPATIQQLPDSLLPASAAPAEAETASRFPAPLEPPPLSQGPHLGYALQWFSFALIGIIGWLALVLQGRSPRRSAPPAVIAALLLLSSAEPALAQLRPLEGLNWRVFDEDVRFVATVGTGVLWSQPAPLAGTEGHLLEIGNYGLAFRSGRIAVEASGTAVWRLREDAITHAPAAGVRAAPDGVRQDVGVAMASASLRLSPSSWPADVVVRFGATIPTTSDESGLDRDRTDVFALVGARYRTGGLSLTLENGVGINGTLAAEYPQSDVWTYAYGAGYDFGLVRAAVGFVGRQDGHSWIVRGNEDLRELRVGFDAGGRYWLGVRYIRGLSEHSPDHGVRIAFGFAASG
ncbi:MAG: SURF1 family protein [Gemmatimonadota bacterium]